MRSGAGRDAVVIGGGAAGIAAARALHDAGRDVLLLEGKDRLGGRAHSMRLGLSGAGADASGVPGQVTVDCGCGWLHSARRNPWTALAGAYGLTVDRTPTGWREQWRDLGFSPDEREAFGAAWEAMEAQAHGLLAGVDRPLADAVAPGPWRLLIDAISGYANGAQLANVSLHDWAAYEDAATDDNWAVREGYGTLVARHAEGVSVRLGTRVLRIDHRGRTIRVETDAGTIETGAVVVALPTTVLARGDVAFDPPLRDKQAAAEALPLGLADKIFLVIDGPAFPANAHLIGDPHSACTASYRLAPFGQPLVEVFVGGDCAEMLERESDAGAADFAIGELLRLLGRDWRFTPLARTRWRHDPLIGGSYSHARVGMAGQRAVLAEPIDGRLFFAGEACSATDFSTAHGAYETGVAAAHALLATIAVPG
ncbi:flavin monoamine oxidase family protein [Sphingomonas bacterium]|uniref:flavin monoamine oxidase family protein n=1 Tax=Sphingomonas bacterium TaxID=1895847 RepID=UPI001574FCC3|nr:NAD(P)/FAD-dependent oxidoreductase [Sphingomonas bacterium]